MLAYVPLVQPRDVCSRHGRNLVHAVHRGRNLLRCWRNLVHAVPRGGILRCRLERVHALRCGLLCRQSRSQCVHVVRRGQVLKQDGSSLDEHVRVVP